MQLNDAARKLLYRKRSATSRCRGARREIPSPMKVGTTVMMNSSIEASSRKDPMIPPPPIIQTFLPACVRRRSAKAPIDSVSAASHQANRNVRQEQVREARRHEPSGK